jgi:hypothetical protein
MEACDSGLLLSLFQQCVHSLLGHSMGRGKHNKGSRRDSGGSQKGPLLLDRNLTPRIEEYALNHDISDVDDVVEYLRRNYREYQRKQVAALRQMVTRALQVVQQKGVAKPELQIQVCR